MNIAWPPAGVGWIIALIVMILAIVFAAVGQMEVKLAVMIAGLALARLI